MDFGKSDNGGLDVIGQAVRVVAAVHGAGDLVDVGADLAELAEYAHQFLPDDGRFARGAGAG